VWVYCTLARSCLDCDHESFFIHIFSHSHHAFTLFFARTLRIHAILAHIMHLQVDRHQLAISHDELKLARSKLFALIDDVATNSDKVDFKAVRKRRCVEQASLFY
jgi:hypothetical protein